MIGIGALLGLLVGVGAHIAITQSGPWAARTYVLRIERHLAPPNPDSHGVLHRLSRTRGTRIADRQRRAGLPVDPAAHLLTLLAGSVSGLAAGTGVVAFLTLSGRVHQPFAALPLLLLTTVVGWLLVDRRLDTAARRRREQAVRELPAIAESLAIAVGAGAALVHACELVASDAGGVLAAELRSAVEAVMEGSTVDAALAAMSERIPEPSVGRFLDALRIAMDRGTPIVDVLHAQAADARHASRRALMEQAGRREIAMLIPVVFCVLPAVVVIALYPGFRELTSMV